MAVSIAGSRTFCLSGGFSGAMLLAAMCAAFAQAASQPSAPARQETPDAAQKASAPPVQQLPPPDPKVDPATQASGPAPVVTSLDIKPGDRWVYDIYDDITGDFKITSVQTVSEVKEKTYSVLISGSLTIPQVAGNPSLTIYDSNWNLLEDPLWRRHPGDPLVGVKLPLKLGEQWETRFDTTRRRPEIRVSATAVSKVLAWEHVKLRNGEDYDAYRIEVVERVKAFGTPKRAELKSTMWFAPAVNRFVKQQAETRIDGRLTAKTSEYLTDYTRRDDDE